MRESKSERSEPGTGLLTVDDFLTFCLASRGDSGQLRGALPKTDAEWSDLLAAARREGLTPLLHRRLRDLAASEPSSADVAAPASEAPPVGVVTPANDRFATGVAAPISELIPEAVRARLHRDYLWSAAHAARLFHQLANVLSLFRDAGLRVVVLKGAHLAEAVYEDIALRPMVDVDLLLPADAVRPAGDILRARGFRERGHDDHHLSLVDPSSGVPFELHWALSSQSFPFRLERLPLWERTEPARVAGVEVEVLAPEDLLLHLSVHAAYHHVFDKPRRFLFDIAAATRHYQDRIDWESCERSARAAGLTRPLHLSLWLARRTFDCPVPDAALRRLEPPGFDPRWAEAMLRGLLRAEPDGSARLSSANLSRLWGPAPLREKAGILARSLFPSPGTLSRMYGVPAGSLGIVACYPRRWRDHFTQHRRSAWDLLRRRPGTTIRAQRENELRRWLEGAS